MKRIIKFFQLFILVMSWGGAQAQYCTPTYSTGCTYGDGLTNFQLGGINQTIPCSGSPAWYHDYTGGTQGTLWTGISATLTVTAGYSNTHVTVWIDLNNNSTFDSGETMVTDLVCATAGTQYTAAITVPAGSTLGTFRLRYRTNWLSAVSGPCTTITYGNAADFTVNVTLPPPEGTLQGTIRNAMNNQVLSGVMVTVNALTPVTSNAAGFYQKTSIPVGTCTINATLAGFLPYSGTATITAGQTTIKDFSMNPVPSYLSGFITNAGTNAPVQGALIEVGTTFTYSLSDGSYFFEAYPAGSQTVKVSKPGFDVNSSTVNITNGGTTTYNAALMVTAYPPGNVTATLNGSSTAVNINWAAPTGFYELIYDDGIQENWTVWASAGNMKAVKFTPITGSVQVFAGLIDIGKAANYAAGTNPTLLAPFQVAVYDATGINGLPGVQIGDPIDVVPTHFGWNSFSFPTPVTLTGDFYLVMIQGGTPPNAAGLAIDETNDKQRSYSKDLSVSGEWLTVPGNYMIRCVVSGQGGPLDIYTIDPLNNPTVTIPYTIWRLMEGQEGNEALWGAPIGSSILFKSYTDNAWPALPCAPWRWAVKAGYPGNRMSAPAFSNVLGKCWTAQVTITVDLTCSASPAEGTIVKLQNIQFPQYVYTATTTTGGTVVFPAVWKGIYDLTISKSGYETYSQLGILIMGDQTFGVILQQEKLAPSNLFVDNKTLKATWNVPAGTTILIDEAWTSGNFTANQWTADGNWLIRPAFGHPAPAAEFYWSPTITNYSRSITSKTFTGTGSPDFKLMYDIYYSDYGGSLEELAVEYQAGGAGSWMLLKHYDNTGGDIPWTTETIDMSSVGTQNFKIRFRAYGVNSFNINNWDFDNIKIISTSPDPKPCILEYAVYLNNVPDGTTQDTIYTIPPSHVTYNTVYNVCVKAEYGSGDSDPVCYTLVSKFLYPPTNLQVSAVECDAYLTWEKPQPYKNFLKPEVLVGLIGYKVYRDGSKIADITDPDVLFYTDFIEDLAGHEYEITAYYDLAGYGYPGQYDESMMEGPKTIDIECGREIPFCEDWQSDDFATNGWILSDPTNLNWTIDIATGNQAPSADFSGQPVQNTYELSLESPVLDGWPFSCAEFWLDFDYKLVDNSPTGAEKLQVDLFCKGLWKNEMELVNDGDKPWTPMHVNISSAQGRSFKIRFRATGANSSDILHWYIDNICIYAKCKPPKNLHVTLIDDKAITLTWQEPQCMFNPAWLHWDDGINFTSIGPGGAATFDIAARWDAAMIAPYDGGQVTKIAFFPSSNGIASYRIRIWQGTGTPALLVDQSVTSPTNNQWNIEEVANPVPIDITQDLWIGLNVNSSSGYPAGCDAGPVIDGYGNMIYWNSAWVTLTSLNSSLTYNWNIQGYVESGNSKSKMKPNVLLAQEYNTYKSSGSISSSGLISRNALKFNPEAAHGALQGSSLLGYNLFRSDDNQLTYNKVNNAGLIPDLNYIDNVPYSDYLYWYYVTAVHQISGTESCESGPSNIISVNTQKTLSLRLLLEGLHAGGGIMNQAYDEFGPHFGPGIADQVTIELHNDADYATVEYTSGLVDLNTNGEVTISGISSTLSGSYYITVIHRNSILTASAFPVSFALSTINYDFTTAASQAYGDNLKYDGSQATVNYYVIWAGDVNQDGIVDSGDINPVDNAATAITFGYVVEDVNGDGIVDSGDMNILDNNTTSIIMSIVP
jgi:hypothetical protein